MQSATSFMLSSQNRMTGVCHLHTVLGRLCLLLADNANNRYQADMDNTHVLRANAELELWAGQECCQMAPEAMGMNLV